jgi:hypothetical protein
MLHIKRILFKFFEFRAENQTAFVVFTVTSAKPLLSHPSNFYIPVDNSYVMLQDFKSSFDRVTHISCSITNIEQI